MESNEYDEAGPVQALKNGCRISFTSIYNEFWYPMFLLAYRKLENREIAEEIVQEIFTRLWRDKENLVITNLRGYLFASVRYEIIDHIRKKVQQEGYVKYCESFAQYENLSTENTVYYNDLLDCINKVSLELPDKTREIFNFSRIQQWPVARIAKHLKMSEKSVEYHLTRATKFMKNALRENLISAILPLLYFLKNILF